MIIAVIFFVRFVMSFITDYRFCQNNIAWLNPKYMGAIEGGQELVFD